MSRTPKDLKGKVILFSVRSEPKGARSRLSGDRLGKVIKVEDGPRKGFTGVTVLYPPPTTVCPCPDPACPHKIDSASVKVRLGRDEIREVRWFGKLRDLGEWLAA
jgi:hypothetical protein